jgi:hypothetical protein
MSGGDMIGMMIGETKTSITLSYAMDMYTADNGDSLVISFQSTIPFGLRQDITIKKNNIIFMTEPNEFLYDLYMHKSHEALDILTDMVNKVDKQKELKNKRLN